MYSAIHSSARARICDTGTGRPWYRRMEVWLLNKGMKVRRVGQSSFHLDSPCPGTETKMRLEMVKARTQALIAKTT